MSDAGLPIFLTEKVVTASFNSWLTDEEDATEFNLELPVSQSCVHDALARLYHDQLHRGERYGCVTYFLKEPFLLKTLSESIACNPTPGNKKIYFPLRPGVPCRPPRQRFVRL